MTKSKIYTKTGDKGQTGLVSGSRVSKADLRIDAYGDVDELNSYIGLVMAQLSSTTDSELLGKTQSALFDLGSNLACEEANRSKYKLPQIKNTLIEALEKRIDEMDSALPALKNFIMPGGSVVSGHLHVARTICRRVERKLISYKDSRNEQLPDLALEFINRLSDYLFVLSRFCNHAQGVVEIEWISN